MLLPLRRFLRPHVGSRILDLPPRTLPAPRARKSSRALHLRELGFQFRPRLFRPPSLREHKMGNIHPLRRLPLRHVRTRILCFP